MSWMSGNGKSSIARNGNEQDLAARTFYLEANSDKRSLTSDQLYAHFPTISRIQCYPKGETAQTFQLKPHDLEQLRALQTSVIPSNVEILLTPSWKLKFEDFKRQNLNPQRDFNQSPSTSPLAPSPIWHLCDIEKNPRNIARLDANGDHFADLAHAAIKHRNLGVIDSKLWQQRDFVLKLVKIDGEMVQHASEDLKGNDEIGLATAQQYGPAVRFLSRDLQDRQEIRNAAAASERALGPTDVANEVADLIFSKLQGPARGKVNRHANLEFRNSQTTYSLPCVDNHYGCYRLPPQLFARFPNIKTIQCYSTYDFMTRNTLSVFKHDIEQLRLLQRFPMSDDIAIRLTPTWQLSFGDFKREQLQTLEEIRNANINQVSPISLLCAVQRDPQLFRRIGSNVPHYAEIAYTARCWQHSGTSIGPVDVFPQSQRPELVSRQMWNESSFAHNLVKIDGAMIQTIPERFRDVLEIGTSAVKQHPPAIYHLSERVRKIPSIYMAMAESPAHYDIKCLSIGLLAGPEICANKDVALAILNRAGNKLDDIDKSLRDDPEVVLTAIKNFGPAIRSASERWQRDPKMLAAAETAPQDTYQPYGNRFRKW